MVVDAATIETAVVMPLRDNPVVVRELSRRARSASIPAFETMVLFRNGDLRVTADPFRCVSFMTLAKTNLPIPKNSPCGDDEGVSAAPLLWFSSAYRRS